MLSISDSKVRHHVKALLDVSKPCGRFVLWFNSKDDWVERQPFLGGRVAVEQQERSGGRAISIWSSTSRAVTLPACQEVCGELGWRSVGTTRLASCWAEGRNRWAIWWLAGTRWGLFCSRVCVCVCVASTDWASWYWETTCLVAVLHLFHVWSAAPY